MRASTNNRTPNQQDSDRPSLIMKLDNEFITDKQQGETKQSRKTDRQEESKLINSDSKNKK